MALGLSIPKKMVSIYLTRSAIAMISSGVEVTKPILPKKMVSIYLTRSAIAMISSGVEVTKPILQESNVRLLKNTAESAMERYRTLLSDDDHVQQGMLVKQMNDIV